MDGSIPAKKARADQSTWRPQTRAVRGGQLRSNFDETSEALFLTSGYAYQSAEEAEATFKGESGHYQYSRFGNPTVAMFENRLAMYTGMYWIQRGEQERGEALCQKVETWQQRLPNDHWLRRYALVWAAAGHPAAVFSTTYDELVAMTGAPEIDVE